MREYTLQEFRQNEGRIANLVATYRALQSGHAQGRRNAQSADTLRAAVVFLHSALEEVFRNLFLWKLPQGSQASLNTIPLKTDNHRPKGFLLGDLLPYEGRFVHNIIRDSIETYVDRMNINNLADLREGLKLIGIETNQFDPFYPKLAACMARRHQIVHQMDRNHETGRGSARVQTISVRQVTDWQENTHNFVFALVAAIDDN
ncbi:MAG: hypothetical protein NVV60_06825 [Luteimonas sp.]|nr:hypothetical protein [Luteimonas sp.]